MVLRLVVVLFLTGGAAFAQYVDLSGEWRIGKDDNPRYAQADFDDSAWGTVRLPWEVERPLGVYWLRKTVATPASRDPLTLAIGSVNESYEVYVNGARIATTPGFGTNNPPYFEPRVFPLASGAQATAKMAVALRIWRPKKMVWILPKLGKDFGSYAVAAPQAALSLQQEARLRKSRYFSWNLSIALFLFFAAFYLMWTFHKAREWRELFWLAVFCIGLGGSSVNLTFLGDVPSATLTFVTTLYNLEVALNSISIAEFLIAALRIRPGYWRWLIWLTLPLSVARFWLPLPMGPGIIPAALCFFWGIRALRGEREMRATAFLAGTYSVVRANAILENGIGIGLFPTGIDIWQIRIPISTVSGAAIAALLMFVTLGRLIRDKGERHRLAGELQAAREVQQLMLSGAVIRPSEYEVDAVYYPAQEVGGDFYRIVEDGDARVVVVGDVSGKGLKAAMHVSEIVGGLRIVPALTPAAVLAALNRVVVGHLDGGFVTCCCARLEPGGAVLLANAGHLNPYRNGREVEMEGGLPLGVLPDARYQEMTLQMAAGEKLTFLSDGVVEAANAKGELFGFDRTREISANSAAEIADAAKAWGQNDDITVVTVRRV